MWHPGIFVDPQPQHIPNVIREFSWYSRNGPGMWWWYHYCTASHTGDVIRVMSSRRKFRRQTSDDMDRWKAEMGRVREEKRREEKKKEDQKRESLRRKKIQEPEKVGKSRNTVFLPWFVSPEGRKVGSLKRRVRSQLARWEMKIARRWGAKHISKSKCINTSASEHF